jgi:uncharacterized lipoprotein YddW (UPF0748 family)
MKKIVLFLFCILCIGVNAQNKHEMRAAWIATVVNIDWPEKGCFDVDSQKQQMLAILDSLDALNFNAIVFQIRPTSDAFYQSELEPWSMFLTGKQGVAPEPFYDPLEFTIAEAHKRQIEVHVWLNPYRVLNTDKLNLLSYNHLYYRKPELFVKYGRQYYFNPGLDETRNFLNKVVADIVSRYDIDAVHFDDYFYPYRIEGEEFPDDATFKTYPRGFQNKDDWRRNNVNLIIQELNTTIKSIKPWVEFGISPFGVWRNADKDINGSATQAGCTNYDDLYADVRLWLQEGWIDYVVPQLYWEIGKEVADYEVLVDWWSKNSFGRNLYIGLSASTLGSNKAEAWERPNELCRQLAMNKLHPATSGAVYFSCKGLLRNAQGLCDSLQQTYYKYPALNPNNSNLGGYASAAPRNLRIEKGKLLWDSVVDEGGYQVAYYVVYMFDTSSPININKAENILMKTNGTEVDLSTIPHESRKRVTFVVTSVNRFREESPIVEHVTYRYK